MKAGDVHPKFPDVVRVSVSEFKATWHDPRDPPCIGCPSFLGEATFDMDCAVDSCGDGYIWFGESVRVINKLHRQDS